MPVIEKVFRFCLKHRKAVITFFVVMAVFNIFCIAQVKVNTSFNDYLPKDSPSTVALNVMDDNFDEEVDNARVYVTGIDQEQAAELDKQFAELGFVIDSKWLGDSLDPYVPLEMQDEQKVAEWKDDDGWLFQLVVNETLTTDQVQELKSTVSSVCDGATAAVDGDAPTNAEVDTVADSDMSKILLIAIAVVLLFMGLATKSFLHPIIALGAIGIAIIINMGTNIVQGEVSSTTQLVVAVLQLAVSMDYSIVLLTNFEKMSRSEPDPFEAMIATMVKSFPVILASACVTFFGFLSLVLMRFLIGVDMGVVLAKGIFISFFAIMFLMPCLMYVLRRACEKLSHKSLLGKARGFSRVAMRVGVPALVVLVIVAPIAFTAEDMTNFSFGSNDLLSSENQVSQDSAYIEEKFGATETWAILVPKGEWDNENAIVANLKALPETKSVTSYSTMVGSSIPTEVTGSAAKSLISGDYSRIVLTLGITGENDQAYELVNEVRSICAEQYGDTYYLTGTSVATSDVKDVAMSDAPTVKIASAVAIGIVLLIMLQSLSLPLILLLAIEASIWINFSVPYFMGSSLNYIGYLVVDAVQVGAAVDYAIILVHEYLGVRKKMPARQAAMESIARAATPLFTSSGILMLATLGVYFVSACPIDQQLGILICRGIFIADVIIFAVLPTLLVLFDRVIDKTSRRLDFFKPTKTNSAEKLSKSDA